MWLIMIIMIIRMILNIIIKVTLLTFPTRWQSLPVILIGSLVTLQFCQFYHMIITYHDQMIISIKPTFINIHKYTL